MCSGGVRPVRGVFRGISGCPEGVPEVHWGVPAFTDTRGLTNMLESGTRLLFLDT